MTKRILASAALFFPLLASADTLILKNGQSFLGNFNSANSSQVSFTEYNGNRQMLNMYDVQEIRFGNDSSRPADTGFGRNTPNTVVPQPFPDQNQNQLYTNQPLPPPGTAPAQDLDRLQGDIQTALADYELSGREQQLLRDSSLTVRDASMQLRANRPVNVRALRLALDNIRTVADTFEDQDRDRLFNDVRRVGVFANTPLPNGGRNY